MKPYDSKTILLQKSICVAITLESRPFLLLSDLNLFLAVSFLLSVL